MGVNIMARVPYAEQVMIGFAFGRIRHAATMSSFAECANTQAI
jgi:hypothetical protein